MCKLIGHIHPPFSLFAQKLHQFKRLLIDILDARIHRYLNSSHKKNRPIDLIDLIIGEVYCIYTQNTSRNCEKRYWFKAFYDTPRNLLVMKFPISIPSLSHAFRKKKNICQLKFGKD